MFSALGYGGDLPAPGSPALLLKAEAIYPAASPEAKSAAVWAEAGVRMEVLSRFGRLLPRELTEADRQSLISLTQDLNASDDSPILAAFPKADDLVFDGQGYAGANLGYIDSMLGKSGRPIAFDRALPAMLVPLTPEAETALVEMRAAFQAGDESRQVREIAEQTLGPGASAALFADGQFLRAYAGRFDDLYFHLFQNGNGASALAFEALADGLGERAYRPAQGICRKESVPAASFDLNDILSDGGKAAVASYLRAQSARPAEAFKGFAFRILPSMISKARTLPAGTRFSASQAEILQALRARQHFYPIQVSPLYRSPDRFLGWAGSFFIPVATGPALPPGAVDSWYPLPQRQGRAPVDSAADGASSAQLFESSSAPDMVWEDPQLSNLLADPETRAESPKGLEGQPPAPGASRPKAETDPRLRAAPARLIAVVTPTVAEAGEYLAAIAQNDKKVRAIEQARGRLRLLRQFIESARSVSSATFLTPDGKPDRFTGELRRAVSADLESFQQHENELEGRLQEVLRQRAGLRTELENRLTRDRVRPLEALGKKAGEAGAEKSADRLTL